MSYKFNIIIEKDDNGYFAYIPQLKGCMTQGDTYEEVMKNIKEAAELYLEVLTDEEKKAVLGKEVLTTQLEVDVV